MSDTPGSPPKQPRHPNDHNGYADGGMRESYQNEVARDLALKAREAGFKKQKKIDIMDHPELLSDFRIKCIRLFRQPLFDSILGMVIFANMVLVIFETDAMAENGVTDDWMASANHCLLFIYAVELSFRIYAFQKFFVKSSWNLLDFTVVGVDLILFLISLFVGDGDLPSVSFMRIGRLARLARAFKAVRQFEELNHLIRGFIGAMRAMFWGMLMVTFLLVLWSVFAVQVIHPVNLEIMEADPGIYDGCDRCPRAYASVFMAFMTFFQQLVAGDSWGTVSLPIIDAAPWTSGFFAAVLITVNLAMLNLILAIIVEAATSVKIEDSAKIADEEEHKMVHAKDRLLKLCAGMDKDNSGALSIDELMNSYENSGEFAEMLRAMQIEKHDMDMMFQILDHDGSGEILYSEFVDQLHRMKSQLSQLILFLVSEIKFRVIRIEAELDIVDKSRHAEGASGTTPRHGQNLTPRVNFNYLEAKSVCHTLPATQSQGSTTGGSVDADLRLGMASPSQSSTLPRSQEDQPKPSTSSAPWTELFTPFSNLNPKAGNEPPARSHKDGQPDEQMPNLQDI